MKKRIKYCEEELSFLFRRKKESRKKATQEFNDFFGRCVSVDNIKALYLRHGWRTGRSGRFEKGHVPSPDARLKRPNKTSFKLGDIPANTREMGAERITKDGYIEVKVAEHNPHTGAKTRFRLKHRWVWEQHNGKVPKGQIVKFTDGDRLNCELENLFLASRALHAHLVRNNYNDAPAKIKPTLLALSKLQQITQSVDKSKRRRCR
jgi:hypothetical protein